MRVFFHLNKGHHPQILSGEVNVKLSINSERRYGSCRLRQRLRRLPDIPACAHPALHCRGKVSVEHMPKISRNVLAEVWLCIRLRVPWL